jgi:hypothetical protein
MHYWNVITLASIFERLQGLEFIVKVIFIELNVVDCPAPLSFSYLLTLNEMDARSISEDDYIKTAINI